MRTLALGLTSLAAGCYSSIDVVPAIESAWVGHSVTELREEWGEPTASAPDGAGVKLLWKKDRRGYTLPSGSASLSIKPGELDFAAALRPGEVYTITREARALIDGAGLVARVQGANLQFVPTWGPPNDANLHWGFLLGMHAGMGALHTTSTPLPSGGLYIGGMIGPQLGLVGTFSMVAGKDDAGGALGFAWGFGPVYWPMTRLSVRGAPAALLYFEPGFENVKFAPGVNAAASYAVIKSGTFALDLRADLNLGLKTAFGTLGVGVNLN